MRKFFKRIYKKLKKKKQKEKQSTIENETSGYMDYDTNKIIEDVRSYTGYIRDISRRYSNSTDKFYGNLGVETANEEVRKNYIENKTKRKQKEKKTGEKTYKPIYLNSTDESDSEPDNSTKILQEKNGHHKTNNNIKIVQNKITGYVLNKDSDYSESLSEINSSIESIQNKNPGYTTVIINSNYSESNNNNKRKPNRTFDIFANINDNSSSSNSNKQGAQNKILGYVNVTNQSDSESKINNNSEDQTYHSNNSDNTLTF